MTRAVLHDTFIAVNGPEDGTEWPVTQNVFYAGRHDSCVVHVRLDDRIQAVHARLNAESTGYRIRSHRGAPVFVNKKKATVLRSQILKPGDVLRLGSTALIFQAAPDGLMNRSRGIPFEYDVLWIAHESLRSVRRFFKWILNNLMLLLRVFRGSWFFILLIGFFVGFGLSRGFRARVGEFLTGVWNNITSLF